MMPSNRPGTNHLFRSSGFSCGSVSCVFSSVSRIYLSRWAKTRLIPIQKVLRRGPRDEERCNQYGIANDDRGATARLCGERKVKGICATRGGQIPISTAHAKPQSYE